MKTEKQSIFRLHSISLVFSLFSKIIFKQPREKREKFFAPIFILKLVLLLAGLLVIHFLNCVDCWEQFCEWEWKMSSNCVESGGAREPLKLLFITKVE